MSMKSRVLVAGVALLALTGCDSLYGSRPQGPYGAPGPYPAPEPYPPYPSNPQPYPPGPGTYPGQPGGPTLFECPIVSSSGWTAWINAQPGPGGGRPVLVVSGKVVTATGGYQVAFDRYRQIRRGQPAQAFVTLQVAPPNGGTWGTQAIPHQVRWEWPLNQPIGGVIISCGDKTLAELTIIKTAY